MKVFGYRGYAGKYPENSMLAFQKAIEAGAEGIQLNIHYSRDRNLVIIHDDALSRTVNGVGFVRHHNLSELKSFEIKGDYEGERQHLLTLEEYMEWAKDLPVITCISLMNDRVFYPGMEDEAVRLIKRYHMESKAFLCTKRSSSVSFIKDRWPDITVGWGLDSFSEQMLQKAEEIRCDILIPNVRILSEEMVVGAKKSGIGMIATGVNTEAEMDAARRAKVDAIITMFIENAKRYLGIEGNPYSEEQIQSAQMPAEEQTLSEPKIPIAKIRLPERTHLLKGGFLGLLIAMTVSIIGATVASHLAMNIFHRLF